MGEKLTATGLPLSLISLKITKLVLANWRLGMFQLEFGQKAAFIDLLDNLESEHCPDCAEFRLQVVDLYRRHFVPQEVLPNPFAELEPFRYLKMGRREQVDKLDDYDAITI